MRTLPLAGRGTAQPRRPLRVPALRGWARARRGARALRGVRRGAPQRARRALRRVPAPHGARGAERLRLLPRLQPEPLEPRPVPPNTAHCSSSCIAQPDSSPTPRTRTRLNTYAHTFLHAPTRAHTPSAEPAAPVCARPSPAVHESVRWRPFPCAGRRCTACGARQRRWPSLSLSRPSTPDHTECGCDDGAPSTCPPHGGASRLTPCAARSRGLPALLVWHSVTPRGGLPCHGCSWHASRRCVRREQQRGVLRRAPLRCAAAVGRHRPERRAARGSSTATARPTHR